MDTNDNNNNDNSNIVGGNTNDAQISRNLERTQLQQNNTVAPSSGSVTSLTSSQALPERDFKRRPVYRLSVNLINTYKNINKKYYEQRVQSTPSSLPPSNRSGVNNFGYDDKNYDYIVQKGENFAGRYILKSVIGKGSFGQVVEAHDTEKDQDVAIKIIKSKRPFKVQAQTEINLLTEMRQKNGPERWQIVCFLAHFEFRNHVCLVFEMLSYNLYEVLRHTKFQGVSFVLLRKLSKQINAALAFLSSAPGMMDIIHCDLKPENILLKNPGRSGIRLIDFGSSCYRTETQYTYIQSRFYRSPEVLFGLPYDQKIDMWSYACVLVEMHTGEPLFGGTEPLDQVCKIVDVLGMPPASMLERSPVKTRQKFFFRLEVNNTAKDDEDGDKSSGSSSSSGSSIPSECDTTCVCYNDDKTVAFYLKRFSPPIHGSSRSDRDTTPNKRSLADILCAETGGPSNASRAPEQHTPEAYKVFIDFILKMLVYEPSERIGPWEARIHPFHGEDQAFGLHQYFQHLRDLDMYQYTTNGTYCDITEQAFIRDLKDSGLISSISKSVDPETFNVGGYEGEYEKLMEKFRKENEAKLIDAAMQNQSQPSRGRSRSQDEKGTMRSSSAPSTHGYSKESLTNLSTDRSAPNASINTTSATTHTAHESAVDDGCSMTVKVARTSIVAAGIKGEEQSSEMDTNASLAVTGAVVGAGNGADTNLNDNIDDSATDAETSMDVADAD